MSDTSATDPDTEVATSADANWLRRILIGLSAFILLILLIVIGGYFWLDSDNGKRFVADQINALEFENGMEISIGELEGSLYGKLQVVDLEISDPKGVFVKVPSAAVDWSPFAYLNNVLDIKSLIAPEITMLRLPEFNETPESNEPLLPEFDISVDTLAADRIVFAEAVAGQRQIMGFRGEVQVADGRALVKADAKALATGDRAGGDMLALNMDARPDDDIFDLALNVDAPGDGLIASLAGTNAPLKLRIAGNGSWAKWRGELTGQVDAEKLADLKISGDDGTFRITGVTQPRLLLGGMPASLTSPQTFVDMTVKLQDQRLALNGGIASSALTVGTSGIVDLESSGFDDLAVFISVTQPRVLADAVSANNLRVRALLNGDFAQPIVAYNVQADRLAFDDTAVFGLRASGESRIESDRIVIPVNARAQRIAGVGETAGELLTNVNLNGDLAYADGRLMSDNLKIRSDRLNATAVVLADLDRGLYTGGLKGQVNNFRIDGVGTFNVMSDVDLKSGGQGFALSGNVRARSVRIDNDGVRDFLGGQSLFSANIGYGSDGIVRFSKLRVAGPDFRLTSGEGSYTPSGGINLTAKGNSSQYGPLAVRVRGSVGSPRIRVAAARPGFGVGMRSVVADIRSSRRGYLVAANGETDYGPFSANVDILSGSGPLTIDIARADFAGIAVDGRIRQTAAGPFAGRLNGAGQGFDGEILLSSLNGKQRLQIDATGRNMALQGPQPLSAQRAIIDADIVLYDQPDVTADVQLQQAMLGGVSINLGRAKINYAGGVGTAKIFAEGRNQVPFRVAANADLGEQLWRIAAKGRVNGLNFATVKPMRIVPERSRYRIMPSTVKIARGTVKLAGYYGDEIDIDTRLDNLNLAALNPMLPNLGIGGTATGSLDWYQASSRAFPRADARLKIDNFTRSGLASQSLPVDVTLVGKLLASGGDARAVIRRRGAAVGRMQASLSPLPPGAGPWMERLLRAPLSGGIRYNGPADALFSLAALPDQSLKGQIGMAADFSGRVATPQLTGVVRANNLIYLNETYGTKLTKLRVRGKFTNDRLQVTELSANAGDGTITGKGFVSLSSGQGFPVQLNLNLDNARLAKSELISAEATGDVAVINSSQNPAVIRGTLRFPETRYKITREASAIVPTLTGVRRKPRLGRKRITGDADPIESLPSKWKLALTLKADNQLYVSGMGLESEWSTDLRIRGTTDNPRISGRVNLLRGTLGIAGRSFKLQSGRISFAGAATNPQISIKATSVIDGITTQVNVTGSGQNPNIAFSSTPALPQDEVMARILFGNSIAELSVVQAAQLAASLNSLRGGSGGLNPLGVLQSSTGLDRLRILGADDEEGRGASVAFGQYITNDVYVEIITDARGYTASQIEVSLTPALSVLSQVGTQGGSNVNVRYRKDY